MIVLRRVAADNSSLENWRQSLYHWDLLIRNCRKERFSGSVVTGWYPRGITVFYRIQRQTPSRYGERKGVVILHGAAEMAAQHVEQLCFGRAVYGNRDPVTFSDAHGHHLHGMGKLRTAGAHLQDSLGIGIAVCQLSQAAGSSQKHGKFVAQGIAKKIL